MSNWYMSRCQAAAIARMKRMKVALATGVNGVSECLSLKTNLVPMTLQSDGWRTRIQVLCALMELNSDSIACCHCSEYSELNASSMNAVVQRREYIRHEKLSIWRVVNLALAACASTFAFASSRLLFSSAFSVRVRTRPDCVGVP